MKCGKIAALCCAAVLLFAGCAKKEITLDVKKAAEEIKNAVTFQDTLSPLADNVFPSLYEVKEEDVAGQAVYISSRATAEEIAVIEAKDADAAQRVKTAVEGRIEDQKSSYENYVPAELTKLNNPVIEVKGKYVFLCVCDDAKQARDAIDKLTA